MKNLIFFLFSVLLLILNYNVYSQEKEIVPPVAEKVAEGIYVHTTWGANITIFTGKDGLLIIDTGYPGKATYSDSIIKAGFNKPVKYIINTHLHYDHVGGNKLFAADGAVIIAHGNTRRRMMKEWKVDGNNKIKFPVIPPYPEEYLPDICFEDSLKLHFNSETIRLFRLPAGHSDSDVALCFEQANVIVTGDLFIAYGFPPFEFTIEGYIDAIDKIIELCDEETVIIPGHETVSNSEGLIQYKNLLIQGSERIKKLKAEGKTYEEILAAKPLYDLIEEPIMSDVPFIYCVYYGPLF